MSPKIDVEHAQSETTAFLKQLAALPPLMPGDIEGLRTRRRLLASRFDSGPAEVNTEDTTVGGVCVRRFVRHEPMIAGSLVYVHGGGWVAGDVDTHDGICRHLCALSGLTVISVNYSRAPEEKHPRPVSQVVAVAREISKMGQYVIGGDSSGAHIAYETTLELINTRNRPSGMLLIQPAVDPQMNTQSWSNLGEGYFLTRSAMRWFWDTYLGEARTTALTDRVTPTLPPSYLVVSELDPSRDEGLALAYTMLDAGVAVQIADLPSLPHGCLTLTRAFLSAHPAVRDIADWLVARMAHQSPKTYSHERN